jgi:hypothetical protein
MEMARGKMFSKHSLLMVTLFACFLPFEAGVYGSRWQDSSPQIPVIALEAVKDDSVRRLNEPYRVGQAVKVKVIAKNESSEQITVPVTHSFHQNRPNLVRNGKLVEYKPEIAKLLRAREEEVDMVGLGRRDFIKVPPYSSVTIIVINLNDWYGSLDPGSYELTNRYRLKVGGPWSADSKPVRFEVSR